MHKAAVVLGGLLAGLGTGAGDGKGAPAPKPKVKARVAVPTAPTPKAATPKSPPKGAARPALSQVPPAPATPRIARPPVSIGPIRPMPPALAPTALPDSLQPPPVVTLPERTLPVLVGWSDELDTGATWQQLSTLNPVDVLTSHPGLLDLRLPHVPQNYPYTYQWSGLQRQITVDLARYPVAVARITRLPDNSYAQLAVAERDFAGREVQNWITPGLTAPGLAILDVGKEWGVADTRRFTLKLIVGGPITGASCEYDWVRFVNREDVPFLQTHPEWQRVELRP